MAKLILSLLTGLLLMQGSLAYAQEPRVADLWYRFLWSQVNVPLHETYFVPEHATVAVGIASTLVLDNSGNDIGRLLIVNDDATQKLYLNLTGSSATVGAGLPLVAGQSFTAVGVEVPTTIRAIHGGSGDKNLLLTIWRVRP